MDESYIKEILAGAPAGMTRDQFMVHCQLDINAGYAVEVEEAARRYFKKAEG